MTIYKLQWPFLFCLEKFQIFRRHSAMSSYRTNSTCEHEMCNSGVGRRLPFDMLSCLGIRNTIVTFQPDGFYHYFENNNTWSIENLLRDYYAYSKCIPTGMVFCPLWTDTSFVNCTGCSGKKFWILETSYNKGNIKSDYLSNCR